MLLQLLDFVMVVTQRFCHSIHSCHDGLRHDCSNPLRQAGYDVVVLHPLSLASNKSLSELPRADQSCIPCLSVGIVTHRSVHDVPMLRTALPDVA